MKRFSNPTAILMLSGAIVLLLAFMARSGSLQGPVIVTHADVTCPAISAGVTPIVALPQSTPVSGAQVSNRMCATIDWVSGSPMRIGDASISVSQGVPVPAVTGASKTFCGDGPIYCFGNGGTSVGAFNETTRQ